VLTEADFDELHRAYGDRSFWFRGFTLFGAWGRRTGNGWGRGLVVAEPSGFARLIMEAGTPDGWGVLPAGLPDMALYERLCTEIGDETLGPPGTRPGA
jgi:hypothetical protein